MRKRRSETLAKTCRRAQDALPFSPWTEASQAGQDHLVSVYLFNHKPEQCPFGHSLVRGRRQTVGWKPCICTPAREAADDGRGMGHLWISCGSCHDLQRSTTFYEPPHDIRHRQAGPWQMV
jgi:hypothetical protein